MNWIYLLLSSLIEVFWVITLKHSCGFTHLVPSIISIFSMALSTYLLSLAIRSIPIGVCYAIWTGVGAIGDTVFIVNKLFSYKTTKNLSAFSIN